MSDVEVATTDTVPDRRLSPQLIGVLALVATVAVFLLLVRPLLGGGDAQALEEPAAVLAAAQEAPAEDAPADEVAELPLVTYEVFLSRDPFDPVVPEPVAVAAPTDPTAPATPTDPAAPTDPNAPPADPTDPNAPPADPTDPNAPPADPATPPPPAGCTTGETVSCDGRIVGLVEVRGSGDDAVAIVQVDTTLYEVRAGDTFAASFQLSSISGSCVNVLYGDDAFTLCEGDRTLK